MVQVNPIGDLYTWAIQIVGLAVFVVFLWAGLLYLQGKDKQAIQAMKDAVIGTILLFSAYIILDAINPDLVGQSLDFTLPIHDSATGKDVENFGDVQGGSSTTQNLQLGGGSSGGAGAQEKNLKTQ